MSELILSKQNIEKIILYSQSVVSDQYVFFTENGYYATKYKCSKSGLILPYGNKNYGYEHIRIRHQNVSSRHWKKDKRDTPTIFPIGITPVDYGRIASHVILNNTSWLSKDNGLTEYKGEFNGDEYVLVIEDSSKIIITLYPKNAVDKNNYYRDRFKEYNIGACNCCYNAYLNLYEYSLSIINSKLEIEFNIIIKYSSGPAIIEDWYLEDVKNDKLKKINNDENIKLNFNFPPLFLNTLTEDDRAEILKLVKKNI
ncbi:hypothetical protein ACTS93_10700 [Empedobacter falsenii]